MPLIKDGTKVIDDVWVKATGEGPIPAGSHLLVPLARWRDEKDALKSNNQRLGLLLATEDKVEEIASDLDTFDLIAVQVPLFKDGRVFSTARLLRERYGFQGDIRAIGDILPDQAQFLARCGVSEIEIEDDSRTAAFAACTTEMTVAMQPTRTPAAAALRMRPIAEPVVQAAE